MSWKTNIELALEEKPLNAASIIKAARVDGIVKEDIKTDLMFGVMRHNPTWICLYHAEMYVAHGERRLLELRYIHGSPTRHLQFPNFPQKLIRPLPVIRNEAATAEDAADQKLTIQREENV